MFTFPVTMFSEAILAWNLGSFSYSGDSFSVDAQDSLPQDLFFKPDGPKFFLAGIGTSTIFQYSMSTPFYITTASYDSKLFDVSAEDSAPIGLWFKPDGTKMYVFGAVTDDVFQYTLSTPWDVSTASYDSKSFSFTDQDTGITGGAFNADGTKMYALGITTNDRIYQYTLSVAWDVSTASYDTKFLDFSSEGTDVLGMFFGNNGNTVFITDAASDNIFQYNLSTTDDISTASYSGLSLDISGESDISTDVHFASDGRALFITDRTGAVGIVYKYTV